MRKFGLRTAAFRLGVVITQIAASSMPGQALPATAAIPVLSAKEMNCGNTALTDDSGLNRQQADGIVESLNRAYQSKAVKFAGNSFPRPKSIDEYVFAFCGVVRNGHHFIVIDGIYRFLGALICDDAAGFGVVYDPEMHEFGDLTFGVSSCVPKTQRKR
jgi:hypothetical protein